MNKRYTKQKLWRKNNPQKISAYNYKMRKRREHYITLFKNKPCIDCGGWYESCQMDFDHKDPTQKKASVSRLYNCRLANFIREASKCELVCANCHRLRTYRREHGL